MWISGFCRQGGPRFRPPRLGPWPYTVSVANSFRCSFVWVLWPEYQVWSAVVATPLADSKPSYPDNPNTPATARSVYVILHAAALPARLAPRSEGNLTQSSTVKPQGSAGTSDHGPRASCLGLRAFSISFVGSSGISFVGVYIAMHAPIPC